MDQDGSSLLVSVKKYEEMLDKDPLSCCFAPLAELYCKLGLYDEAVTVTLRGIELHPDYAGGYVALGKAYLGKGMYAESIAAFERTINLTPDNNVALKILGRLYVDSGRTGDAIKILQKVLDLNPFDTECRYFLDGLLSSPGQDSGDEFHAISSLEVTPDPGNAESFGDKDLKDNEHEEEFPDFDDDDSPLGRELICTGKGGGGDPLATPTLAEMYLQQGFIEQARDIYRQLLGGDPENQDYRMRIERISARILAEGETAPTSHLWHASEVREGQDIPIPNGMHVVNVLETLLVKIERRRACHSGKY